MIHEAAILAMCLQDPDIWHKANLQQKYFTTPLTRSAFAAIRSSLERHGYIALESVRENMPDNLAIEDVIRAHEEQPIHSEWEYYRDMVVRKYKQRALRALAMEIREEIDAGDPDPDESAVMLMETARGIQIDGTRSRIYSFNDVAMESIKEIERRRELGGEYPGIPMHVHEIDKAFKGFENSKYYLIGARLSDGKSALLLQILHSMAEHGVSVGLCSLESGRREIGMRLFKQAAPLDPDRVAIGTLNPAEYADLNSAITRRQDMPLYLDDTENATMNHIQQTARLMKSKYNIQALGIDYVQLIPGQSNGEHHLEVGRNSIALKNLARELDIPIIAAAQLKREEGKKPGKESFQHADQLGQDADGVLLLHWTQRDDRGGDVKAIIAKNRDGWTGEIDLRFVAKRMIFSPIPKNE